MADTLLPSDTVRDGPECGFTLTEMLVALAILIFGLTALAGSMTVGVSERRGSEMRFRAIHMVDRVFHDLRERLFLEKHADTGPLQATAATDVPGYAGMQYTAKFQEDPDDTQVVLARVEITWKEQGERIAVVFERIMIREIPFSRRISTIVGTRR